MNTDLPLLSGKDDKLNRFIFASEIASGLVNSFQDNNESIVLGINGNWGSGKSTLINFIISEIERQTEQNNSEIITLRFNPWMFSGQKELQDIFLKEMFLKLESNKAKFKDASQKIADFMSHLRWLKYFHQGAGEAVEDLKAFIEGFNKQKDLTQLKEEIDDLLIQSKVKLYITIDDIDRLTPAEITDIFQLVKLNGNFANTIFILAYDQKVVTSALTKQFGDNGKKYIEKIVQVDYTLPSISQQTLTTIFIDSLCTLFPDGDLQKIIIDLSEKLKNKPFVKFFSSLRDIYRFNNAIKLRLPSIYHEVNIVDFLLVESLRIFNFDAYEFVIINKDNLVCKTVQSLYGANRSQDEKDVSSFISKTEFDNTTKEILKFLFTNDSFSFSSFFSIEDLIIKQSVASVNYFDRYFSLQLSSFDIPELTFKKFITNISLDDNIYILNNITHDNKLITFLHWVNIKSQHATINQIENMLSSCFLFIRSRKYEGEYYSSQDITFVTIIRFCTDLLKKVPEIETKHKLLLNNIDNKNDEFTFSSLYIATKIFEAKEKFDKNQLSYDDKWYQLFSDDLSGNTLFYDKVQDIAIKSSKYLFTKEINTKNSLSDLELSLVLNIASKYHYDFYVINFPSMIYDDKDLIKLIWLSLRKVYMSTSESTGYQLSKGQFFLGMDTDEIKKRLDNINRENLSEDENIIVQIFLKAYTDNFAEKRFYNIKTFEAMEF